MRSLRILCRVANLKSAPHVRNSLYWEMLVPLRVRRRVLDTGAMIPFREDAITVPGLAQH